MPTLKANIGGVWTPISSGAGGGTDEVSVGPSPPTDPNIELWFDSDAPGPVSVGVGLPSAGTTGQVLVKQSATDYDATWKSLVQSGTYTPTLSGCAIGTGGSAANTAQYVFVGGPNIGDVGIMYVSGLVTFGTTGATVPQSNPILSLPSGFNLVIAVTNRVMTAMTTAGGGFQMALVVLNSGDLNHITIEPTVISGNIIGPTGMGPTTPAAWAAGNSIRWSVTIEAVRV